MVVVKRQAVRREIRDFKDDELQIFARLENRGRALFRFPAAATPA